MGNKLIVLGAGASIGSKRYPVRSSHDEIRTRMPSGDNFFLDLFEMNHKKKHLRYMNWLVMIHEGLNELITRAWNINKDGFIPNEWKGVNIEDVMTFLEVGSLMSPDESMEQKVYQSAVKDLQNLLSPLLPMVCDEQHCEYLLWLFYSLRPRDSIISYNWDTIADFTLQASEKSQFRNYARLLRSDEVSVEDFRFKGVLLKLHGSFNWMNCSNESCPYHDRIIPPFKKNRYKLLSMRETWHCPACGDGHVKPLIVPPVSNKQIQKRPFLKQQWLIAREKLLYTDEIIFIGYSFPPTDFYTEWLFREINLIEKRQEIKIVVVNPDYGKKYSDVTKRYKKIFKGFEIESYKTLAEFANSP